MTTPPWNEVKRYRTGTVSRRICCAGLTGSRATPAPCRAARGGSARSENRCELARPIKDFKIVIDKGKPDRLVSFCLDNVKKISPTSFEVRMKDFTPDRDLKILLIGKAD